MTFSPSVQLVVLSALAAALIALGIWVAVRVVQGNPEKRERKRRLQIHRTGRLGDALITEASDDTLYYSYTVRGVQYDASQNIAVLRELLPDDPERIIGVANMKYSSNNPANSILICEEWSGLRTPARAASR